MEAYKLFYASMLQLRVFKIMEIIIVIMNSDDHDDGFEIGDYGKIGEQCHLIL